MGLIFPSCLTSYFFSSLLFNIIHVYVCIQMLHFDVEAYIYMFKRLVIIVVFYYYIYYYKSFLPMTKKAFKI